jgi:YD repeat-containing protein
MKTRLFAASMMLSLPVVLFADESVPPPLLEFASGLPGQQVRLSWPAEAGLRYRIERSTSLGVWSQVALVEARSSAAVWLDPEPTSQRAFYRVIQPQAEVFSISPPLLSSLGGDLVIHGQCLPAGSVLVLEVDGVPMEIPLESLGVALFNARTAANFNPGARVVATAVKNALGNTLVSLNQPIEVTATGRATDAPPGLPPAAPFSASRPVPRIGIVVKSNKPYKPHHRPGPGGDRDCDDMEKPGPSGISSALIAMWASKRGYDYYKAASDNAASALHTNPYFVDSRNYGDMPGDRSSNGTKSPLYDDQGLGGNNPLYQGKRTLPNPSALPGEVSFHTCDLVVPCPAGPPLAWIGTYRSKLPLSSGHGPGWDFSYNISIEPIPSTGGTTAPRLRLRDGGGQSSILHRQADGTYRCDGMFREGSFDAAGTFTLTFANTGRWVFQPPGTAPAAGKVASIIDRNGVALACAYDSSGQLESVSDGFGRSLAVEWGGGRILSVTARKGATELQKVSYTYSAGKKTACTEPYLPSSPPASGAMTFTYDSSASDPRIDDNLLSVTDASGRLMEAFTYSTASAPGSIEYDTCATHDRHGDGHVTVLKLQEVPPSTDFPGGYRVIENDELGRVTETVFDRLHRAVVCREFTGFAIPGVAVTDTSAPFPGRLRAGDPAYFETRCSFNADHRCTELVRPDGTVERIVYDRDFRKNGPVREGGNPRVISLIDLHGSMRTVSCDYKPGFGTPELAAPGNPIGGISIKGGRNPGGGNAMVAGNPIKGKIIKGGGIAMAQEKERGITINTSHIEYATRKLIWSPRSNFSGGPVDGLVTVNEQCDDDNLNEGDGDTLGRISMNVTVPKQTQGATFGERLAGGIGGDCDDGDCDDDDSFRKLLDRGQAGDNAGFVTRLVTAHGQVYSWERDVHGNCTAATGPLPGHGKLYQYNTRGQCTSVTETNGPGSSFHFSFTYDPTTGFPTGAITDPASGGTGLNLATSFTHDDLGRLTRVTDPLGHDTLIAYNPAGYPVAISGPSMPSRISMNFTLDAAGRVIRCDLDHRRPDGSLDPENPAYSTFHTYDGRGRLVRVAEEELPVDPGTATEVPAADLAKFAVCDFSYDVAGQCVRMTVPAACRNQSTDLVRDYRWDERGLLHRCIEGGLGSAGAVTTECDYDLLGSLVRCATVVPGIPGPEVLFTYDSFRRPSSITDPMGNVASCAYANDGTVTFSVHGEVEDIPGSAGNTLLSVHRLRKRPEMLYQAWDNEIGSYLASRAGYTTRRRVEVLKSNKQGDPNANRSVSPPSRPVRCWDGSCAAFFAVETEDDTMVADRFTPGSTAPPVTETTVVDRSPAGLIQSVTRNGDLLLASTYDRAGRVATCTDGASTVSITRDARGDTLVCGQTDHFRIAGKPDKTFSVSYVRDPLGRVIRCTDGRGNVAQFQLDSLGRRVLVLQPGLLAVHTAYDLSTAAGPLSTRVSADVDGDGDLDILSSSLVRCGEPVHTEDSYGHRTSFTRDGLGRRVRTDHSDLTFETVAWDALGRAAAFQRKNGAIVTCDFDARGRVVSVSHSSLPKDVLPVPPSTRTYDGLGRLVRCEEGDSLLEFSHDSLGNLLSETQNGQVVSSSYNHRGRTTITYPDGRRFAESRDALGLPLSITALNATGLPDPVPVVVMEYAGTRVWRSTQANGVVTECIFRGDGDDADYHPSDFSFDACVKVTVRDSSSNLLCETTHFRNADQREIRCDTAFTATAGGPGRIKEFTLNPLGDITRCVTRRRELAGTPPIVESDVTYELDLEGRRITATGGSNPGAYTQDNGNPPGDQQMGQYSTWPGGALEWTDNGNLKTIHRSTVAHLSQYDAADRLVSVSDPAAGTVLVSYTYDALGRVSSSTTGGDAGLPPVITSFVYDGGTCIQELNDDGSGNIDAAVTIVASGGVKHCISTRNGTLYYPVDTSAAMSGGPRICTCPPWNYISRRRSGGTCPGGGHAWPSSGHFVSMLADDTGTPLERFDCDDAGTPIFLAADGTPTSASSATGPIRWMSPEALWEPSIRCFVSPGGVYNPDLGMTTSAPLWRGHVTVLK